MINVDAPGSTSANLPSLGHTRCARPMYPMESDADVPAEQGYRALESPRTAHATKDAMQFVGTMTVAMADWSA